MKILGRTGYPEPIPGLLEAGAETGLVKPVDLRRLRQKLAGLLASIEA